jgi:hypothetical protein
MASAYQKSVRRELKEQALRLVSRFLSFDKKECAGATVLVAPCTADRRSAAMVQFPGGYIAEIRAQRK